MSKNSQAYSSFLDSAFAIMQREIFIYFLNIITGIIIARTLGPELLGVWVLLTLVSAYAEGFGRLKTDQSSVYIIGNGKVEPEKVLFSTTIFACVTSLSIVFILNFYFDSALNFLFRETSYDVVNEFFFLILLIPFEFLLINLSYFFIAMENVLIYNRLKVLQSLINFAVMVALILFLELGIWALIIARFASIFLPLVYAWLKLNTENWIKLRDRWDSSLTFAILQYATNFYFIGIIGTINRLTIKSIAALSLNTSQLAFYNQGEAGSRLMNVIPNSISIILYPKISKLDEEQLSVEIALTSFRVTLLLLSFVGLVLYLFANPLVIFAYGIDFIPTAHVLKIAIPGVIIGSTCLSLQPFFEGRGIANLIPKLQIGPVIFQIILSYYLILNMGLVGAAYSFSLGSALYGMAILIAFVKINKLSFTRFAPQTSDVKLIYNILKSKIIS